jgi:hypothetical protein
VHKANGTNGNEAIGCILNQTRFLIHNCLKSTENLRTFQRFVSFFRRKAKAKLKYEVKAYLSGITPAIDFIIFTDIKCYKY